MENSNWCHHPYLLISLVQECILQAINRRNLDTNSATKLLVDNQSVLPTKYAMTILAQNLWEQQINIGFDLVNTPLERTSTQHRWGN